MVDTGASFVSFATWEAVQAHIRAGLAVYYQAPLDYRPVRIGARVLSKHRIRVRPPTRDVDPFTADRGHLERFKMRASDATEQRRALCARIEAGNVSTKDFLETMGLTMDQFLNYAQMTPERMRATADAMRTRWGLINGQD